MYYWTDNHGNIYGPYSKQADGYPNAGEVIRFYREQMGMSQARLGELLRKERTWINKMERNNQVPELLSRRRAIIDILKIPPVLFGLSVLGSDAYLTPLEESHTPPMVRAYSIEEANEYIDDAWELHRLTGSMRRLPGVLRWKARIKEDAVQGGKNLELLHRYDLLLLQVGRARQDYTAASPEGLVELAEQIGDPETLGVSLYRRGAIYFEQGKYKEALDDVQAALSLVENAGPYVRGLVLISCGPVLAHYAADKSDVQAIMKNLDKAWECVEEAEGDPDIFFTAFDKGSYYADREYSLTPLLRLDPTLIKEVWEALDLAKERVKQQHARTRAGIEVGYAEASFHVKDYTPAVSAALEAVELDRSVNSSWHTRKVQKLYGKLTQTRIKDSKELRELRDALKK